MIIAGRAFPHGETLVYGGCVVLVEIVFGVVILGKTSGIVDETKGCVNY
jgi:hypothetical protein